MGRGREPCKPLQRGEGVGRYRARRKPTSAALVLHHCGERGACLDDRIPAGAHELAGLEPGHDVHMVFTGIRPGERLNEILFAREQPSVEIGIAGIVAARPVCPALDSMRGWLVALQQALAREDRAVIYRVPRDAVPDFRGEAA